MVSLCKWYQTRIALTLGCFGINMGKMGTQIALHVCPGGTRARPGKCRERACRYLCSKTSLLVLDHFKAHKYLGQPGREDVGDCFCFIHYRPGWKVAGRSCPDEKVSGLLNGVCDIAVCPGHGSLGEGHCVDTQGANGLGR